MAQYGCIKFYTKVLSLLTLLAVANYTYSQIKTPEDKYFSRFSLELLLQVKVVSGSRTEHWHTNLGLRYERHPDWGSYLSPRAILIYESGLTANLYRLTYSEGFRDASGVSYSGGFLCDGRLTENNFGELAVS